MSWLSRFNRRRCPLTGRAHDDHPTGRPLDWHECSDYCHHHEVECADCHRTEIAGYCVEEVR